MTRLQFRKRLEALESLPKGAALEVWAEVEDLPGQVRQVFPTSGEVSNRQEVESRKAGRLIFVEYVEGLGQA